MMMAGQCAPMSWEEIPPLHFRLKPKIPLKLRSFISGLEAVLKPAECRIGADYFVREGDWTQES